MPQRIQSTGKSRIAELRLDRKITQQDLADACGIPFRTYRRLEAGENWNPPIRELSNIAIALGVELEELIEPEWRLWADLQGAGRKAPDRRDLWDSAYTPSGKRQRVLSGEERRELESRRRTVQERAVE